MEQGMIVEAEETEDSMGNKGDGFVGSAGDDESTVVGRVHPKRGRRNVRGVGDSGT